MAQTIEILNLTDVTKKVVFRDKIEILLPYDTRDVVVPLAAKFFETFPNDVVKYVPTKVPQPEPGEETVWIANTTGNPFVPADVTLRRVEKGQEVFFKAPNPLRKATILKYHMGQGQQWKTNPRTGEEECLNLPKIEVSIPPYQRLRVGRSMADWLLRRDGSQERHHIGKMRMCRGPSYFEPTETWDLDEIRLYAQYVDTETFVRNHPEWGNVLGPSKAECLTEKDIDTAKTELLHKLFFRLVDPRYGLLSEPDFQTVKRTLVNQARVEKEQQRKLDPGKLAALEAS